MSCSSLTRSIELPDSTDLAFRNLQGAKLFALDIGGSLTKIAYYSTVPCRKIVYDSDGIPQEPTIDGGGDIEVRDEAVYRVSEGARLHFVKFETKHIGACLEYVSKGLVESSRELVKDIKATGGGAYKFQDLIKEKIGLKIDKCDEMDCIVQGCNFLLKNISDEAFVYQRRGNPEYKFQTISPKYMYPYLLVTIGSGVSILKVESDDKFERIGGTATGGGTFWGLGKLLTKAKGFDELLELASKGDHRKVDMLVKDIYGERQDYQSLGLPADLIASTFGKVIHGANSKEQELFSDADKARSLLYLISNDIGQISSLYAMLHKVKTIYFGGFFLRHHPVSMHTVGYSVNYWTKGDVQAMFLRHEGYLGAIGAFLRGAKAYRAAEYSWRENMYGSTGFPTTASQLSSDSLEVDHLEIDRSDTKLRFCPLLLNPKEYHPDTVDLTRDNDAREYWLQCLEDSLEKFTERAIQSQSQSLDSDSRARQFQFQFLSRLQQLKTNPFAYGSLTVRSLLDLREDCLIEFDFHDPYLKQKHFENDQAMSLLPERLSSLASFSWRERQYQLAVGLLAGNVFDWGAKEVALLMENRDLDFGDALSLIGPRPWLMDSLDEWIDTLENEAPHKCAAIFIDNSGVDVVLGVLPFVEELLSRGTEVLLCANHKPVLNDVTYDELQIILQRASQCCPQIAKAMKDGRLTCLDSGQSSPCLDLSKLNKQVSDAMLARGVDLLVLEGMGRAVHTNLYATFKCQCLKVAVLKNRWLANRLGGAMYAVVFRFEQAGGSGGSSTNSSGSREETPGVT